MTKNAKLLILLAVVAATGPVLASSAHAATKNPVIGAGSVVSKRVTLTRHMGMPRAHQRRVDYILSKKAA